jgi:hypothetical protein
MQKEGDYLKKESKTLKTMKIINNKCIITI